MTADQMLKERHVVSEDVFVEIVVWRLSSPVAGSHHGFKYRLALFAKGKCVLRYDNEQLKGDHKHLGENENAYKFTNIQALLNDFWNGVDNWRATNG